jgi:hypothetical protein
MLFFLWACAGPDDPTGPGVTASGSLAAEDPDGDPAATGGPLEVCINELMPANRMALRDDAGDAGDWIELHNPTGRDVPLDGWSLTDDPDAPDPHVLTGGLVLEAGGFLVLWADGAPDRGPDHLGFALSESGEAVALFAPDGTGSVVWFGPMIDDVAVERVTDCCSDEGDDCFGYVFAGTPGASNGG